MSFETAKEEKISDKILLLELDLGRKQQNYINYCVPVWCYRFNTFKRAQEHSFGYGNFGFGPFMSSGTMDSGINFTPFDIGSFFVDGEEYTNEESSIADCVSTNKSWYYDRDETVLYMHIDGGEDPWFHTVIIGIIVGLSNKSKFINEGYYRPCIAGGFSIEKSVDPLEFGVVRFSGTKNVSILNEDGYFDNFMDNIVYGQPARVKYGIDDMDGTEMSYADYRQVMKLYIEKFILNWTRCQMVLVDYRKLFSRKLPIRFFNKDDYPNLKDSNVGKEIPLTWGPAYNVEAVCTNEEESGSPANYTFKLVDVTDHTNGIKSIDKVTVETTDKTAYKTDDLANGQFYPSFGALHAGTAGICGLPGVCRWGQ